MTLPAFLIGLGIIIGLLLNGPIGLVLTLTGCVLLLLPYLPPR